MRRYETIYILRPTLGEEEINAIVENTQSIITGDNGVIIDTDRWGMRKLAYPIEKEIQGFYVFCDYAGTPAAVAEVERKFRIDDAILRYMTIKIADAMSEEDIAAASGEVAARNAAVEEAVEETVAEENKESKTETPSPEEETPKAAE